VTRSQATLLRVFALWTIWVWGTRIWNILSGDESTGFKVVHSVLAAVSVALAVAALVVVSRVRRRALQRGTAEDRPLTTTGH
jgi:hypothetical protein